MRTFLRLMFTGLMVLAVPVAMPAQNISPERQDFQLTFQSTAGRCLALAKAIPQDKLSWRPMPGVRSFNEVFVHMAGSTLLFCSYLGAKIPEGPAHDLATVYMKRGFEMPEIFAAEGKFKDSARIVEVMQQSFDQVPNVIRSLHDDKLDTPLDFFGSSISHRRLLIMLNEHLGEHLGQAIAYARVNQIVPPWSQPKK